MTGTYSQNSIYEKINKNKADAVMQSRQKISKTIYQQN